jgi:hexulose-6-phosphate isomerase
MRNKNDSIPNIGFMQGRMSDIRNNRIQSFPWDSWRKEFMYAEKVDFSIIEWTIDSERLEENPLLISSGIRDILSLASRFNVEIPSVTCDYLMENPPWKSDYFQVKKAIISIIAGMKSIDSRILVIPLVDNSSISDLNSAEILKEFFIELTPEISQSNIRIAFESDFEPKKLSDFINCFDDQYFGINYDIGNSASLGFEPTVEFKAYGPRIINVHVKDRKFGGNTIQLGKGDANFLKVFRLLYEENYAGNLIMQTARSNDGKHIELLVKYKKLIENWWEEAISD